MKQILLDFELKKEHFAHIDDENERDYLLSEIARILVNFGAFFTFYAGIHPEDEIIFKVINADKLTVDTIFKLMKENGQE